MYIKINIFVFLHVTLNISLCIIIKYFFFYQLNRRTHRFSANRFGRKQRVAIINVDTRKVRWTNLFLPARHESNSNNSLTLIIIWKKSI